MFGVSLRQALKAEFATWNQAFEWTGPTTKRVMMVSRESNEVKGMEAKARRHSHATRDAKAMQGVQGQ